MEKRNVRVNTRIVKESKTPVNAWLESLTVVVLEMVSRETHSEDEVLHRTDLAKLKYILATRRFIDMEAEYGEAEE